jgi:hypothetical protein
MKSSASNTMGAAVGLCDWWCSSVMYAMDKYE